MLQEWQGRLQDLWVRSPRNRIIIMVSTGVVTILLLCGLCNMIGSLSSGILASALISNPGPKPTTGANSSQINNFNPTFPLPSPTTYPVPNQGATPVGSSGTPAPTATKDPKATPTDQPTQPGGGGGGGPVTFTLGPGGTNFVAGQTNQIILQGPQDKSLSVSVYANPACLNMTIKLDGKGQATLSCDIPANLKNSATNMQIVLAGGKTEQFNNIPIV